MKAIVILENGQKFYTTITNGNAYNKNLQLCAVYS